MGILHGLHGFRARRGHWWVPTASAKPTAPPAPGRPRGCPVSGFDPSPSSNCPREGWAWSGGVAWHTVGPGQVPAVRASAGHSPCPPHHPGSAQPLRKASPGTPPEGRAPLPARGSVRATCPSPCAFLPGACAVGTGCAGRAVLPLRWLRSLHARAPAPPAQLSSCVAARLSCSSPCTRVPGAVLGHSPRPSGARWLPVPRATWLTGSLWPGPRPPHAPLHPDLGLSRHLNGAWRPGRAEAQACIAPQEAAQPPTPGVCCIPRSRAMRGLGHAACQPLTGPQAWAPTGPPLLPWAALGITCPGSRHLSWDPPCLHVLDNLCG